MNIDEDIPLEIKRRRNLTNYYYDNFRKQYEAKNFSKASEFLWGALNALAYAIGLLHGEKLNEHKKVVDFINKLANAYRDKEIIECLAAAQTIHANFFHDFMDESTFEVSRQKTEKLLEKLTKILDEELRESLS